MGSHQYLFLADTGMGTARVDLRDHALAQYFSVILLVRQLLLCDMAYISEYADGEVLTVSMLRRGIADPTDSDLQLATEALCYSNRLGLWVLLSQGST